MSFHDFNTVSGLAVSRVRHEPARREVVVLATERVGANNVSVTFGGDGLEGFVSLGFDDHIKFIFTDRDGELVKREFTPRHFDVGRRELVLEFALHQGGAASDWAERALPGTRAVIGGPKSSIIVPTAYAWHLLAGDPTAAPAIARRLGELPATTRAIVHLLDPAGSGGREFAGAVPREIVWHRSAAGFVAALGALALPEGPGFIWCAGEAGLMTRLRDIFVVCHGHPRQATRIAGYWKADETGFHETFERALD